MLGILTNEQLKKLANAIRFLSIDAIENANSGHPGMPMGFADVATILFSEFIKFKPNDPKWPNRDRFILSAGHGSMLLYSILYLTGYDDLDLDDFKNFRRLHSKLAGHPEYGLLKAIETTTGPLGQGFANGVGMAIAERMMNSRFGNEVINHKTYVVVGDGCLMEGISAEAASLAGHLELKNLIVLYDSNKITIDGPTSLAISENTKMRFEAYNWEVINSKGHDLHEIKSALYRAGKAQKPTLVIFDTRIGYGAPNKESSEKAHGAPLGEQEVIGARANLNWPYAQFEIPQDILASWRGFADRCNKDYEEWQIKAKDKYQEGVINIDHAELFKNIKDDFLANKSAKPTRKSSGIVLQALTSKLPGLIGGSADLSESNNTTASALKAFTKNNHSGRYIHYGVREHAMGAIMNGLALHSNFIPYSGTFLVFSDYMRPAIRLSALMGLQVIYIMTHDSIGLGEDGPTHQPIEHLESLRLIPNLYVFRPADDIETAECWELALTIKNAPSLLALSRQNLPQIRNSYIQNMTSKGAYAVRESATDLAQVVIFASGSEVHFACQAAQILEEKNVSTRVISVPCIRLFEEQSPEYKNMLIPKKAIRVAIEAGVEGTWCKLIGENGIFIGMNDFGSSAPADKLFEYFQITAHNIVKQVMEQIDGK